MNKSSKYWPEILLLFLQFTPIAAVGTVMASLYVFFRVAFLSKIDVLSLFLLLIPSIVFRQNDVFFQLSQNQFGETGWIQFFIPSLKSSVIIGPLAVSTHLFAALAVPVRLFRFINKISNLILMMTWIVALALSILGLYFAISQGFTSTGGITVGLRIVLSLGVLLFPLAIVATEFKYQLYGIIKLSIVLFLLGLMNGHWVFVSLTFPAVILFSKERMSWKILSILMIAITVFLPSTFTIKLIPIFSIFLMWFYSKNQRKSTQHNVFKMGSIPVSVYLFFPIYIVFLTISQKLMPIAQAIGSDQFLTKLFEDRGSIWLYSFDLIKKSNFFIVPAGRDIETYGYGINGIQYWGAGAHNIFLEIARQNGFTSFSLLFILIAALFWTLRKIDFFYDNLFSNIVVAFIAVYMVFGLTGNSLVYDGVGFLFWLIFSQTVKISNSIQVHENSAFISSK